MSRKRARFSGPSRPIDKSIIYINILGGTGGTSFDIITSTFPCTMTGLRWNIRAHADGTNTDVNTCNWAIVLVKDANQVGTLPSGRADRDFYKPEQNVLAHGTFIFTAEAIESGSDYWGKDQGKTKTMRKMMAGDRIVLLARGTSQDQSNVRLAGSVQLFCKT